LQKKGCLGEIKINPKSERATLIRVRKQLLELAAREEGTSMWRYNKDLPNQSIWEILIHPRLRNR
jgi:hypothetical protein